ncbi:hypothetical protein [Denitromonas iodatirespirans]|uniref:Uncharacterized protein n=1 Tax=Denitromonas iodatirespirans TaxID=2795389 RepID=A0A944DAQ9_DENI1|nr:hypothetical protein [Denitromonas iodatirespirans]MBT0963074.1 hypothetical protein [Denitromonas iodatirespirans]
MLGPGHALPLTGFESAAVQPVPAATPQLRGDAFVTGDAPERLLDAPVELGAAGVPPSEALIDPADRRRVTPPKEEMPAPFLDGIENLDELVFDNPDRKAWFADDEDLMQRMRGMRDRFNALLDGGLNEKINAISRELLESLGVEDTSTARLIAARADARLETSGWTAQAAGNGHGPSDAAWASESGRNLLGKFLFLLWDTLTHPVLVTLVLLFVAFRVMLALSRLSARRHERRARRSSRKTHGKPERTAAPAPQWTRRHRVR